jgi:hypothetical protein
MGWQLDHATERLTTARKTLTDLEAEAFEMGRRAAWGELAWRDARDIQDRLFEARGQVLWCEAALSEAQAYSEGDD